MRIPTFKIIKTIYANSKVEGAGRGERGARGGKALSSRSSGLDGAGHLRQPFRRTAQALADLLADSAKERVVDKAWIRELRHAAGVRYLDFTPVMIVALASVIGARYLAIGTGDTELYVFAGMLAAVVISIRVFLFRGAGKAN